ncbi:MAG TPA: hypothetical protein DIU14_08210 [Actinobacteria bacterium]|nr:hypothetical protein [Actinomycetota bacterium]
MTARAPGTAAPAIPGVAWGPGGSVLFFYKVTCPVCQLAAPAVDTFERSYPGRIVGVGQDAPEKLDTFSRTYGQSFRSIPDPPPYPASAGYGIRVVPTLFLIGPDGIVLRSVESWDREGYNDVSGELAALNDLAYRPISEVGDGLPSFRPG